MQCATERLLHRGTPSYLCSASMTSVVCRLEGFPPRGALLCLALHRLSLSRQLHIPLVHGMSIPHVLHALEGSRNHTGELFSTTPDTNRGLACAKQPVVKAEAYTGRSVGSRALLHVQRERALGRAEATYKHIRADHEHATSMHLAPSTYPHQTYAEEGWSGCRWRTGWATPKSRELDASLS